MNKKPKRTKTQNILNGWKTLDWTLKISKYIVAEIPATVMVIVQHKDWFPTKTQTVSVSTGFAMFCATILLSVFCIAKKSKTYEKISPFITAAIYLIIFGVIALFMANIFTDLAWLCIYTGAGMVAAVVEDTVDQRVVQKKVERWENVLAQAGINVKQTQERAKFESDVQRAKEEARDLI